MKQLYNEILSLVKKIISGNSGELIYSDMLTLVKKIIYGDRGEPFRVGDKTLYYVLGTRPAKFKYISSPDMVVRNDVKQMRYLVDNIKPGNFVLDIGGHVGQYAVLLAALVSENGKVVTFEPDNIVKKTLCENLRKNGFVDRVTVEDIALSDTNGTHSFFSLGGNSMSSLVKSGLGHNAYSSDVKAYSVTTMRLDDYLSTKKMGFPDWIKLDAEGAEINVLKGAQNVLRSKTVIVCELHPYAWKEFGVEYGDLLNIVRQTGKKIRYLDESLKLESGPYYGAAIIS